MWKELILIATIFAALYWKVVPWLFPDVINGHMKIPALGKLRFLDEEDEGYLGGGEDIVITPVIGQLVNSGKTRAQAKAQIRKRAHDNKHTEIL